MLCNFNLFLWMQLKNVCLFTLHVYKCNNIKYRVRITNIIPSSLNCYSKGKIRLIRLCWTLQGVFYFWYASYFSLFRLYIFWAVRKIQVFAHHIFTKRVTIEFNGPICMNKWGVHCFQYSFPNLSILLVCSNDGKRILVMKHEAKII